MRLERDEENEDRIGEFREQVVGKIREEVEDALKENPEHLNDSQAIADILRKSRRLLEERAQDLGLDLLPVDYRHLSTNILLMIGVVSSPSILGLKDEAIARAEQAATEIGINPEHLLRVLWKGEPKP